MSIREIPHARGEGLIIAGVPRKKTAAKIPGIFTRSDKGRYYEFTCLRSGCGWTCSLPKEGAASPTVIKDRIVQINEHAATHKALDENR